MRIALFARRSIGCVAAAATSLLVPAIPAAAEAQPSQHVSWDPTGAVFACAGGDVTVTGGTISETFRFATSKTGELHIDDTITLRGVTAEGPDHSPLAITGAAHVDAKIVGDEFRVVTDVTRFVIRGADGVYGFAALVGHYNATSRSFTLTFGDCVPPTQ